MSRSDLLIAAFTTPFSPINDQGETDVIVLINPFEVPTESSDEQFLAGWQLAADYLHTQPGFVRSDLHRATSPDARFRFINVAEWQSVEAFRRAVGSDQFSEIARRSTAASYPGLYEVVRTVYNTGAVQDASGETALVQEGSAA